MMTLLFTVFFFGGGSPFCPKFILFTPPPPKKKKEKREKKKREREREKEDKEQDGKKLTEFVAFFLMNCSILYAFMLFCILVG